MIFKKKGRIRQWTVEVQAAHQQAEVCGITNAVLTFAPLASESKQLWSAVTAQLIPDLMK